MVQKRAKQLVAFREIVGHQKYQYMGEPVSWSQSRLEPGHFGWSQVILAGAGPGVKVRLQLWIKQKQKTETEILRNQIPVRYNFNMFCLFQLWTEK